MLKELLNIGNVMKQLSAALVTLESPFRFSSLVFAFYILANAK